MGLFDFLKKKETQQDNGSSKILLAMPMFKNNDAYELKKVTDHLENFWGVTVSNVNGDNGNAVFDINGEMVALAYMPVPIPSGDIQGTAQYAYNWMTAVEDLKDHTGHAIVSVMAGQKSPLERFKILSQVLCSILSTSNAVGIYQGGESLLVQKEIYLQSIEDLQQGEIPVPIWIYIGLRKNENSNSGYTYGLTNFQKSEMEILNSNIDFEEIYGLLSNISTYVIKNNVTFNNNETLGYTADQKIKITLSKGQLVEGKTFKLQM